MRAGVGRGRAAAWSASGAAVSLSFLFAMASCGENQPAGPGGDCLQVTDCAPGLVCAEVNGHRTCTGDVSSLQPPPGQDASSPDAPAADAPVKDARQPDVTPPRDVNVPDNNVADTNPPPQDSGGD